MSKEEQIGQVLLIIVGMTLYCVYWFLFFSICEHYQVLEVILYFSHMNQLLMEVPR